MLPEENNSRRKFIKLAAIGSAALGAAPLAQAFATNQVADNHQNSGDKIPARKGKSVMGLRCEPLKTVRIGLIGQILRCDRDDNGTGCGGVHRSMISLRQ